MDLGSLLGGLAGDDKAKGQGGDEVLGKLSDSGGDAPMMGQGGAPAGDELGDLLGSLLGGAGGAPQGGAGDPMGDLLGSLLGGAGGAPQGGAGDPMSDLLGSLLGGGGGLPQMGGQANDPMAGMLGGLLGGLMGGGMSGGASPAGNMGGINTALAPLANALADKLGIPRETAMAAMAIIVPMILNKLMSSGQGQGAPATQGLSFTADEQDEMIHQLTTQTGMDAKSAAYTLDQAVQVLGKH
ncbi:MAG: hypothetical protein IT331_15445 [Anaerolineae bacterium]|nr:hypothetical protein [Anaerolineae bacterium]